MAVPTEEINSILIKQITNFDSAVETREVGSVVQVGDGIARVYGLGNVGALELVECLSEPATAERNVRAHSRRETRHGAPRLRGNSGLLQVTRVCRRAPVVAKSTGKKSEQVQSILRTKR